jgi:hypothetical protein
MASKAQRLDVGEFARWWEETGEYELCQVLYWKWDPIGVISAFPYTAHEYDRYGAPIVAALREGASVEEIAETFGVIRDERMGLGKGSPDHRRAMATHILEWFESSQNRWVEFGPLRR